MKLFEPFFSIYPPHFRTDQEKIAEFLILNGAFINMKNSKLFTPLHVCAQKGKIDENSHFGNSCETIV